MSTGTPITIVANDITYSDGEENPLKSLDSTLAFSSNDWGESRAMAWVWGIVCGWGKPGDPDEAVTELAERFGWDDAAVARLGRLHDKFAALEASLSDQETE